MSEITENNSFVSNLKTSKIPQGWKVFRLKDAVKRRNQKVYVTGKKECAY